MAAEDIRSLIRHDMRNRLASIRNAAFYLKTRVEKRTDLFHTDPRVPVFFALIDEEIEKAELLLAERLAPDQGIPSERQEEGAGTKAAAPRRVLLVEDDDGVSLTLSALLEEEGFPVDIARSIAMAQTLLCPEADYSVVLLDMNLPDGNGLDLLSGIRARLPGAKVLAIGAAMEPAPAPGVFDAIAEKDHAFDAAMGLLCR